MAPRTGEMIVERGIASADLVERAKSESTTHGEPLCSRLLAAGIDENDLASVLAEKHGVPGVDLSRTAIPLELLDLVPRAVAEGDLILPVSREGNRVFLAVALPADDRVVAEVRFVTGLEVSPYVAVRASLLRAIGEAYEARTRGEALWRGRSCGSGAAHLAAVVSGAYAAAPAVEEPTPDEGYEIIVEVEEPLHAKRSKPLVLVVDDEREIRALVERKLQASGYDVELAVDGAEALEKAERLVPDLVLLDAMLPKVHGFDACRRIRSGARTRDVPVVMMTAIYRGWRFAQDARDAYGTVDYIEKPFRLDDLVRRVAAAVSSGAASEAARQQAEEDVAPLVAKGKALLADGHTGEAVEVLTEAARTDPASAAAQLYLGRALRSAGDRFGAMTALERAVELRPAHLGALRTLAAVYEETGFRRKAAGALERAMPLAPDDAARAALRKDLMRLIA